MPKTFTMVNAKSYSVPELRGNLPLVYQSGFVAIKQFVDVNLKSSVESLTPRCREAESAEKVQMSDGKENHDKKNLGKFFHPIGENKYILKQWG